MFDDVLSNLAGAAAGKTGSQGLVCSVLELLNSQPGGIAGLAQSFQQQGLGDIAASWIGTGSNLPVSPAQILQVLGSGAIQSFAAKAGLDSNAAGSKLAELLPGIVDQLTPGGQLPQGGDLMSTGMSLLGGLLSGNK